METPRDVLAEKWFPKDWARVATSPGKSKQRQKLRKAAEAAEATSLLHKEGKNCGNCRSRCMDQIIGLSERGYCKTLSDFHSYVFVKETDVCKYWGAK